MFNFEDVYGYDYFDRCLNRLSKLRYITTRERNYFIKLINKLDFKNKFIERDEVFEVKYSKKLLEFKEIGPYLFSVTLRDDRGIIVKRPYRYINTVSNIGGIFTEATYLNKDLLIKALKTLLPSDTLVDKAIKQLNESGDIDLLNDRTILNVREGVDPTTTFLTVKNEGVVITVSMCGTPPFSYTQYKINKPNMNEIKDTKMNINFKTVYGLEYFKHVLNRLFHITLFTNKEFQDYLNALDSVNLSEYEGGVGSTIKLDSKFTGITLTELGLGIFKATSREINYIMTHVDFNVDNIIGNLTERYNISDELDKELLLNVIPVLFKDFKNAEVLLEKIKELNEVDLKENSTFLTISLGRDGDWKFSNERNRIIISLNNNKIMEYHQYMTKEMLGTLTPEKEQNEVEVNDVKEEREMVDTRNVNLKYIVNSFDVITNLKDVIGKINSLDTKEKVGITLSDNEYKLEIIPEEQNTGLFKINVYSNQAPQLQNWGIDHSNNVIANQMPLLCIMINTKYSDIDKVQEFINNSLSMLK